MISGRTAQSGDLGGGEETCRACGVCCDLYGPTLHAEPSDLKRWRNEGRVDLLRRVGPGGELWWAADRPERLDHCPFFSWQGGNRGRCALHGTKPAECRRYPTALHQLRCVMGVVFSADHQPVARGPRGCHG